MNPEARLQAGLEALGVESGGDGRKKLLDYLALLAKWNKVHNLTAIRDPQSMVTLHLLDSLAVLPYIGRGRLLDVGSGAGLPGIPLAVLKPELAVTVIDASHKKASFMRQCKATLGLGNLEVVCDRVEKYQPETKFDMIISRAFSEITDFVSLTRHLLADAGIWLAMKGVSPDEELAKLEGCVHEVVPLHVPGLDAQRHLVILKAV